MATSLAEKIIRNLQLITFKTAHGELIIVLNYARRMVLCVTCRG